MIIGHSVTFVTNLLIEKLISTRCYWLKIDQKLHNRLFVMNFHENDSLVDIV